MHLIDVECTFDNNKLLSTLPLENRVDFRELVKDPPSSEPVSKLRRDWRPWWSQNFGGFWNLRQRICCKAMAGEFQPVFIKIQRTRSLFNPTIKLADLRLSYVLSQKRTGGSERGATWIGPPKSALIVSRWRLQRASHRGQPHYRQPVPLRWNPTVRGLSPTAPMSFHSTTPKSKVNRDELSLNRSGRNRRHALNPPITNSPLVLEDTLRSVSASR